MEMEMDREEKVVGKGATGVVWSCVKVESGEKVAVKKIEIPLGRPLQAMRTLREIQILRQARHENVISIKDAVVSRDSNSVYVVQELMDIDLGHVFESGSDNISGALCRHLLLQTLLGVRFLHSAGVVHRDLKPENLLLALSPGLPPRLKIADFGHACTLPSLNNNNNNNNIKMTDRVGTTRYKAPELLFGGSTRYTAAVDVWSLGCIFGQMLGGGRVEPLFPGTGTLSQINEIFRVLGTPASLGFVGCERALKYLNALPYSRGVALRSLYPAQVDPSALDLLAKMLHLDPRKRITAEDALRHPYFATRPPNNLLVKVAAFEVDDEDDPDSVDESKLREMIREELLFYQT